MAVLKISQGFQCLRISYSDWVKATLEEKQKNGDPSLQVLPQDRSGEGEKNEGELEEEQVEDHVEKTAEENVVNIEA